MGYFKNKEETKAENHVLNAIVGLVLGTLVFLYLFGII